MIELNEKEEEFIFNQLEGVVWDTWNFKRNKNALIGAFKDEFNKEINIEYDELSEFVENLELSWCEICGVMESVYAGGGINVNGEVCCEQCLYDDEDE